MMIDKGVFLTTPLNTKSKTREEGSREGTKTCGCCTSCLRQALSFGMKTTPPYYKRSNFALYSYFFLPMVFPKALTYIVVLALCAMDFWLTQNIIGRKLVKLRWWYIIDDSTGGEEVWLFES